MKACRSIAAFLKNERGALAAALIFVLALLAAAFYPFARWQQAEAVLGGVGNVTNYYNPHNLAANSSGIKAVDETQICIFCHTPHSAITNAALINGPLWNHTLSSATYTISNAPGASGTQVTTPLNPPDGASRMCLSCHDGTVSLGNLATGNVDVDNVNSCISADDKLVSGAGCNAWMGTDLTTHHLVSIPINLAVIANKVVQCNASLINTTIKYPWHAPDDQADVVLLRPTAQTAFGSPGVAPGNTGKYKQGYNYGVQCSTCHDPHLWASTAVNSTGYKFLVTEYNSICKACHYFSCDTPSD
jgi:hypothetical protein